MAKYFFHSLFHGEDFFSCSIFCWIRSISWVNSPSLGSKVSCSILCCISSIWLVNSPSLGSKVSRSICDPFSQSDSVFDTLCDSICEFFSGWSFWTWTSSFDTVSGLWDSAVEAVEWDVQSRFGSDIISHCIAFL